MRRVQTPNGKPIKPGVRLMDGTMTKGGETIVIIDPDTAKEWRERLEWADIYQDKDDPAHNMVQQLAAALREILNEQ